MVAGTIRRPPANCCKLSIFMRLLVASMVNGKRSRAPRQARGERLRTGSEVAQALGCSRQRVHQFEARALRKIRQGLKARGYDDAILDIPAWIAGYLLGLV